MKNYRHRLIIVGEVTSLLSVMRGGNKWSGTRNSLDNDQNVLINGLLGLRDKILKAKWIDLLDVIRPFCDVVINEETTGPVTGQAIFSLDKFLASGLFDIDMSSTSQGIREVAEAVTHARFVGTNTSNDEVVLMRILRILNTLLTVQAGSLLTNECVCEIMQSCFRICFEGRLSELLHCFAENTLIEMIRVLFSNLDSIKDTPIEEEDDVTLSNHVIADKEQIDHVKEHTPESNEEEGGGDKREDETDQTEEEQGKGEGSREVSPVNSDGPPRSESGEFVSSRGVHFSTTTSSGSDPHGMACIREVLKFIIAIINPRDRDNSNRLIAIGLGLITVMLECGGNTIGTINSLKSLIQDGLSHHLLLLLSTDSLHLFSQALRNFYHLIEGSRQILKLQLERFLSLLMDILKSDKQHPAKQELCLECIIQLCHIDGFVPELYVNYDCSIYCTNLCERLNKHLSKQVFASNTSNPLQSTNILALDTLLAVISSLGSTTDSLTNSLPLPTGGHHDMSTLNDSVGLIFSTTQSDEETALSVMEHKLNGGLCQSEPNLLSCNNEDKKLFSPATSSGLLKSRQLKKLIAAGTEQFNKKPSNGITFLMEQGVLQTPLDPWEVATFIHANPNISKQSLGDYLGNKKNANVLEPYVKSFKLQRVPLVESLREFLESFRLPGEAPVISNIMERFSNHWMECNSDDYAQLFVDSDAVFVLCYAILMLHTDLHSSKLKQKMSLEEFIYTRRGMNNGKDFPRQLLTDIYNSIRTTEIVLPSEQGGKIREDYEWKLLLSRGDENYYLVNNTIYNQDIFFLCWGPVAAAMSSALDNWPANSDLYKKVMAGYRLCASIAAQYEQREVFDNLIIQLSKFTSLLQPHEQPQSFTIAEVLHTDLKSRLSLETLFSLAHCHGNLLREGWKNILDCLSALFSARLLPEGMVRVKDFLVEGDCVSLYAEEAPTVRADSSLLGSFFSYNYWLLAGESSQNPHSGTKALSPSEVKIRNSTVKWIQECGAELLFSESKFLSEDSLSELRKALIFGSHGPDIHQTLGTGFDEETAVFYLELLITVTLENRDRVELFLTDVTDHMTSIILSKRKCRRLRERSVIALLHLAIRLMHREPARPLIIHGLQSLFLLSPETLVSFRVLQRQISHSLMELINSMNTNTSCSNDWITLFSLFELCATSTSSHSQKKSPLLPVDQTNSIPPTTQPEMGVVTEEDTSIDRQESPITNISTSPSTDISNVTDNTATINATANSIKDVPVQRPTSSGINRFDLLVEESLPQQDPESFFTVCDALSYIVRSEQCINEENFTSCLKTVRLLTEVTSTRQALKHDKTLPRTSSDQQPLSYAKTALQLLDLLDTLYLRTNNVFTNTVTTTTTTTSNEGGGTSDSSDGVSVMWHMCWCPLLEGIARLCCDPRSDVRQTAISYLQRALLAHTLHSLKEHDWEACFLEVFFPMLSRLMEFEGRSDIEETRMRACNLLCKVFLQRLQQLSSLLTFTELWVGILGTMDKYMHIEASEILPEAIPESLKNMLLVMETQGVLQIGSAPPLQEEESSNQLWFVTWYRVEQFLPSFLIDLFPQTRPVPVPVPSSPISIPPSPAPSPLAVIDQPRYQPSPTHSNNSSPLSQSPGEESGSSFPIVIHPPLPTVQSPVTVSLTTDVTNE